MIKKFYILLYLVLPLLGFNTILAQETNASQDLTIVLAELQERFAVQFNYASTVVDDISVSAPDVSLSLEATIENLREQSKLNFVFISDSIISIKRKNRILCGYLKDEVSGEFLPYVTVQNGALGTITNADGYFEIEVNTARDIIIIRRIGHKTLQKEVRTINEGLPCTTLYLIPNHEQLAEIVVYDYLIRGIDKLDNGSYQIDLNRFSILPGLIEKDVLHAVKALPGIQSIDETVSNLNIRGGSNDQNLITWDGIKMYQSGHFFGLISMYNPNITQKVTLRKNGSSSAETDGVSGTLAMMTDSYINPKLKGSIGVNLLDGNGYIDTPIGQNASLQVAARKSISDFVETPTYSEYFGRIAQNTEIENNSSTVTNSDIAFDFYDTSFRLLFNPSDKDRLQVNFIYTANDVRFNESAEVAGSMENRKSELEQLTIAGGLQYQRNWTQKFDTELAIYESDYQLKGVNANIEDDQRFLQKNTVSETSIKFKTRAKFSQQIKWTNGYHFVETKVSNLDDIDDPRYVLLEGEVLRTHSVFTEMNLSSINKATHLNLGLRYTNLDKFKKQIWEPRLSFNHGFGKHFNVEVLGEFKHQNTSQIISFQNDFLGIEKRRWQLSNNESIPVITSKQASLGLSYNRKGWLFNAVSFVKKVDGITTQSQGFQDQYEFAREKGSYSATGMDLLIRKQLKNGTSWISYAYLNSDYTFKELQEPKFPGNFDITHALSIGANYSIKQLLFSVGLNWRTGKPYTKPIANDEVVDGRINFNVANGNRQDDYLRFDLSTQYQFNWSGNTKLQLGLALWNVFDRNNTVNTFYRMEPSENVQKTEQSALGFTPNASIRLVF